MKDSFLAPWKEQILLLYTRKNDPLDKENYRPVSILPLLSKVYERAIFNQLSENMEKILNKILCGFRKARTQHALIRLLQAWLKELDNSGNVGTILMDVYKQSLDAENQ